MRKTISITDILNNSVLSNVFFRKQALNTLNELLERATDYTAAITAIEDDTEMEELDYIEEMFYSDTVEDLARYFSIKLKDEDEDN